MSLFDVIGCRAMRSLFDIRRCRYCSLMVVISNMHCVDSREGDESARAEAGRVGAESASLPVTVSPPLMMARPEPSGRVSCTDERSVSGSSVVVCWSTFYCRFVVCFD